MVTLLDGGGANRARRVAAAGRFGQREEGFLLTAQGGVEVALLLVLVGLVELGQARAAEGAVARRVQARAMLRHLDRQQYARDQVDRRAAVFLRNVQPV